MTQLSEDFFLEISEAMRMSEKQSAGNGDEDRKESPRSRRGQAARFRDRFEEREMPRGRKRPAANYAPRKLFLPEPRAPTIPSREQRCPPNDGCTRTRLFPRECSGVSQSDRERRIP